jgi:hypothetical protein
MTDLSKHGLEPVAWMYECDGDVWSSALEPEPTVEDDWTETPLYRADQVAEVVERLDAALRWMLHAVCHETGFAAAVRQDSGLAYPWPPLDIAEAQARAALEGNKP